MLSYLRNHWPSIKKFEVQNIFIPVRLWAEKKDKNNGYVVNNAKNEWNKCKKNWVEICVASKQRKELQERSVLERDRLKLLDQKKRYKR